LPQENFGVALAFSHAIRQLDPSLSFYSSIIFPQRDPVGYGMTELQLLASFGVEFIESFLAYLVRASSIHTSIIALAGVLHRRGHKYKYLMIPPDFDIDFSLFSSALAV
jgi:hypothetical protein